jgi:hypothetical protein
VYAGWRDGPSGCGRAALGVNLSGAEAVIAGRSNLVGKPIAQLLLGRNATVTVAHSRTRDLAATVSRADVLVAAVGRPEMIRGAWIKPGAIVIDVGINRVPRDGQDAHPGGFRAGGRPARHSARHSDHGDEPPGNWRGVLHDARSCPRSRP